MHKTSLPLYSLSLAMALLFLLSLLMTSFTVFGEELHNALPPSSSSSSYYPPYDPSSLLHPQTHSPLKPPPPHHRRHHHPPASAPAHSPKTPPPSPIVNNLIPARNFVSVQGVVYVKSCKYFGIDTLLEATPLPGAIVKLECNNTMYQLIQTAESDKNGYFFLEASKTVSNYGADKCNVVLVSAPTGLRATNINGGITGSPLKFETTYENQEGAFTLYSVGPFGFECI